MFSTQQQLRKRLSQVFSYFRAASRFRQLRWLFFDRRYLYLGFSSFRLSLNFFIFTQERPAESKVHQMTSSSSSQTKRLKNLRIKSSSFASGEHFSSLKLLW